MDMTQPGNPSLSPADIAFETAFARIESKDRRTQREGLEELRTFMKSGTATDTEIVNLMTNDRLAVIGQCSESHSLAIREQADLILGAWVTAQERAAGITDNALDRMYRRLVMSTGEDGFKMLSDSNSITQMDGVKRLIDMVNSPRSEEKAAFMTLMMETENRAALEHVATSALPYLREAAQTVLDAHSEVYRKLLPGIKKPPTPFLG